MKWFEAWVTFSCVVVPAGSWACARIREATGRRDLCRETTAAARDLELPCADLPSASLSFVRSSDRRRFVGVLAELEGSLISERACSRWPAR